MRREVYLNVFHGFVITHAHIINSREIAFFIQKKQLEKWVPQEELPSRVVLFLPDEQKENDGFAFKEFKYGIKKGYVFLGSESYMVASRRGDVWESKTDNTFHKVVNDMYDKLHMITGLKQIGDGIFASGTSRKIYQREDFRKWSDIVDYEKHNYVYTDIRKREAKKRSNIDYPLGFSSFDGFSENEIYAGGVNGSFWYYIDERWYSIDLKENADIVEIICTDRQVYVCFKNGVIFTGRENKWEKLKINRYKFHSTFTDIKSAVWFQGKLYVNNPFNIFIIENEDLELYEFPENGPKQNSFGCLLSGENALLSFNENQALIFNGTYWETIVGSSIK